MTAENSRPSIAGLVRLAQMSDKPAFGALIEETQVRLYRFCMALCADRSGADDLFQETYLRAFLKIKNLREADQFLGWLFKIAKNLYLDGKRSEQSKVLGGEEIKRRMASDIMAEPADVIAVRRAMSQFEARDRYLLCLTDLAEFTYAEAAQIMGESEAAVKSRVFRIRKQFVKILNQR